MNMCSKVYNSDAVSLALWQSVGDKELMAIDLSAPRETFRPVATVGVTAECNDDASVGEQEEGDEAVCGVHEN